MAIARIRASLVSRLRTKDIYNERFFLCGSEATEGKYVASQLMFKRLYGLIISANEKAARSSTALLQPFIYFKPHETTCRIMPVR